VLRRTSKARWRIAALDPKGTQGLAFSSELTNLPGTPWRSITSRYGCGTSTIRYTVDGGAAIGLLLDSAMLFAPAIEEW
jgi:hypothetical protein